MTWTDHADYLDSLAAEHRDDPAPKPHRTQRHDPIDPYDPTPNTATTGDTTMTTHDAFLARVNDAIGHEPLVDPDPTPPHGLPRPTMDDRPDGTTVLRSKPSAHVRLSVVAFPTFTVTTIDGPAFGINVFEQNDGTIHTVTYLHGADHDDTRRRKIGGVSHVTREIGPTPS
jgi:hypothetical protein